MEIKNKQLLIKYSAIAALIIIALACFLGLLSANLNYQEQLRKKADELKEAKSASKSLKKLQGRLQDIAESEKKINNQVPYAEKYPFSLIRTLTAAAGEMGLRKAVFSIQEEKDTSPSSAATPPAAEYSQTSQAGPVPIELEMKFEGAYPQLLDFLQKLMRLERLVAVNQIKIERKEKLLPYQQITLQLTTYTFLGNE